MKEFDIHKHNRKNKYMKMVQIKQDTYIEKKVSL